MNKPKISNVFDYVGQWHEDRNLIEGATHEAQFKKLLEEMTELYAGIHPEKPANLIYRDMVEELAELYKNGRIKQCQGNPLEYRIDAMGDMAVVLENHARRDGTTLPVATCVAYDEIKDRKGILYKGNFIKEEDL